MTHTLLVRARGRDAADQKILRLGSREQQFARVAQVAQMNLASIDLRHLVMTALHGTFDVCVQFSGAVSDSRTEVHVAGDAPPEGSEPR
ncbi:hypothetical protein [Deinococcus frigens]|uniref:hypothetical protein n=1 Tax=Deinococcus frigens TaxID=249403 RepID=UPI0012EB1A10|nr:hypothetical protein [Deinococcus frigens]